MLSAKELFGSIFSTAWEFFILRDFPVVACKVAVFFSYQLSLTSIFILVTIAISRLLKVVEEEHEFKGHGRGKGCSCTALKVLAMRAVLR